MRTAIRPDPLTLAKAFALPQREIAARLDCTVSWLRVLGRDPRQHRRIMLAVLESLLDRERESYMLDSMLSGGNGGERA